MSFEQAMIPGVLFKLNSSKKYHYSNFQELLLPLRTPFLDLILTFWPIKLPLIFKVCFFLYLNK